MEGACSCGNITFDWQPVLPLATPRACQCDYCQRQQAAYVSETQTGFSVYIRRRDSHRIVTHGTGSAQFHECTSCDMLVFVSSLIDGKCYGVINTRCLKADGIGVDYFDTAVAVSFAGEQLSIRLARRKKNWCKPVTVIHSE